jgi:DNA-directed RNA polymerase specialized sigma subunit
VHLHEIMMKVRKAEKELANDLRREPTKQEVANKAGISEAKLHGLHKVTISWHCLAAAWMAAKLHVCHSSKIAEIEHSNWHDEQQEQVLGLLELLLWFVWLVQVTPVSIACLCFS